MAQGDGTSGSPSAAWCDRRDRELIAVVQARVSVRFAVDVRSFCERVVQLARRSAANPADHATRLSLDDLYLATACAEGDEAAWAECAKTHFSFIRDFARKFLADAAARDLADQVIADLWQRHKIGRYEGRSTLRTWIGTVVANAAVNASRSPRTVGLRSNPLPDASTVRQPSTPVRLEDAAAERDLAALVAQAVGELAPEDKVLLQLYYEQGLTLDEMEGPLRMSKATLSRRLKRVREQLRESIDRLARGSFGVSADALRDRLELDRLELDLAALLGSDR
jgi:RNA polymerase sigma-70 factor (ECF subfamily)